MKKRPMMNLLRRVLPALAVLLGAFVLTGCDDDGAALGLEWRHPSDLTMPAGFEQDAPVPTYTKRWHMPPGFAGFPERWNARVREYVQTNLEENQAACTSAMVQYLTSAPGSARQQRAKMRFLNTWPSFLNMCRRKGQGDYLHFLRENQLPEDLEWHDGMDQPELGSPKAVKGGTLRLALQRSFPSTFRMFGPNSNNAFRRYLYDDIDLPLIRLHPGTGKLIPGTADRWAVSKDGRTVYFHIDESARFSDGSRLTTRDFITSLYVRTSPYSVEPFYNDYYMGNFSRIEVYGNQYLAVTLAAARPYAPFYASVPASCTAFFAEFGPDYPTRYLWRVAPTTGGYTVNPYDVIMGRQVSLIRVPDWWAAGRKYTRYSCNVDHIVYQFVSESTKIRELFRLGELDVFNAREADFWYEGLEMDAVHRGLIQRVHFNNIWPRNCFGFHLNCSQPPFNLKHMRRGFHHALNVQAVLDTVFRGDYTRLGSYFSGFGQYTDESIKALPFEPEKARACFARAGYTEEGPDGILCKPDGTRLQVVLSSRIDPLYTNCMNILREEAARCGLDLRLEQIDDTVLYSRIKSKQYQAAIFSWGFSPPLPDPAPFFDSSYAFKDDGTPMPGTSNITATNSPSLDRAILACRAATSEAEAVAAHHQAQQLIAATLAWVPGWTTSYWRFAQWRWLRWPDEPECRFCPPRYYDPLDSHLYWIDERMKAKTMRARHSDKVFPETDLEIPLPAETTAAP